MTNDPLLFLKQYRLHRSPISIESLHLTAMISQNTLEMAKQGDPNAIAAVLSDQLLERYDTTASVIRLGNYVSVLIEATFAADQTSIVNLVLDIVRNLSIPSITTIEISARHVDAQKILWSQTIELSSQPTDLDSTMNEEILSPETIMIGSADPESVARLTSSEAHSTDPVASAAQLTGEPHPIENALPTEDDWTIALQTLLKRPETVAVFILAILFIVWDAYIEAIADADPTQPLSASQLASRLGISRRTLNRYKHRDNFGAWSQDLDPDGIGWSYEGDVFVPKK